MRMSMFVSLIIVIPLLIVPILFFVRNNWVYIQSVNLVHKLKEQGKLSDEEMNKYLSYNQMLFRFWVWDIEKLKKK